MHDDPPALTCVILWPHTYYRLPNTMTWPWLKHRLLADPGTLRVWCRVCASGPRRDGDTRELDLRAVRGGGRDVPREPAIVTIHHHHISIVAERGTAWEVTGTLLPTRARAVRGQPMHCVCGAQCHRMGRWQAGGDGARGGRSPRAPGGDGVRGGRSPPGAGRGRDAPVHGEGVRGYRGVEALVAVRWVFPRVVYCEEHVAGVFAGGGAVHS